MDGVYRPEFEAALRSFARASSLMTAQGFEAPVLVGGAAVEIFTASAIATGDFDIVTGRQDAFEAALISLGFIKPSGPGKSTRGWIHVDLQLSFEVVSTVLLDGLADRRRVLTIDFGEDGSASVISVEDMIADRMGQFASGTRRKWAGRHARCSCFTPTWIGRILKIALSRKPLVTIGSKTLIPFEKFAVDIARRRAMVGEIDVPRNAGNRRTESKRALLTALAETGARW